MSKDKHDSTIREAVGIFFDSEHLHEAVYDLCASGFGFKDLGLLAGESTVQQQLGDFYSQINRSSDGADGPATAFVAEDSVGDTVHAYLGTLFFVGTTTASGAVVASAAVLGGALLPAIAGAAALGAVAAAMSLIIHQSDAEHLEQQIDEGHILLFVRTGNAEAEKTAVDILTRHGAFEARVIEATSASA